MYVLGVLTKVEIQQVIVICMVYSILKVLVVAVIKVAYNEFLFRARNK